MPYFAPAEVKRIEGLTCSDYTEKNLKLTLIKVEINKGKLFNVVLTHYAEQKIFATLGGDLYVYQIQLSQV